MNAICLDSELVEDNTIFEIKNRELIDRIGHILGDHSEKVLKICLINRGLYQGKFTRTSKGIYGQIIGELPSSESWFNLIVGLSRPPTCQKIIEHSSAMGLKKLLFFPSALSEKSFAQSKIFLPEKLNALTRYGLSQGANYFELPKVLLSNRLEFDEFKDSRRFVLDPFAEKIFSNFPVSAGEITLLIGPERGFVPKEVEVFKEKGFEPIRLSSSILRVENAVIHALGQLELLRTKVY